MITQVSFTKTLVGWYNVKFNGQVLNLDPITFEAYFPHVDKKSAMGCFEYDYSGFHVEDVPPRLDDDAHDWDDTMELMKRKMA
ncbi:hypothetical protein [Bacillus sp. Hm123]|uniref:hypothetical protein n=1 Tax=Bacillus sp. Hm123 TaxID=3450745 RepID=UPI003F432506